MSKTSIQWCDHSVNPFRARNIETGKVGHFCVKISAGCKNCYSSRIQKPHLTQLEFIAENRPKVELFLEAKALEEVIRRKKPTRYFWCDMTDMFMDDYPDEWIDRCFAVMALTPQHTHMVLTKRADRLAKWATRPYHPGSVNDWLSFMTSKMTRLLFGDTFHGVKVSLVNELSVNVTFPLPNVWLGVSVEDQKTADERIPLLLKTPATIRFVSYEPALGPVDFNRWLKNACPECHGFDDYCADVALCGTCKGLSRVGLDWIIVGGESGPGARPFDITWAHSAVTQCRDASVACFVKQIGAKPFHSLDPGYPRIPIIDRKGGDMTEWPVGLRVRQFPEVPHA